MRVGQKNSLVYQWAKKGTRPHQPKDQRYENAYLFGAVCPSRDTGVAIIMPYANTAAMRKHLEEIQASARATSSRPVSPRRNCATPIEVVMRPRDSWVDRFLMSFATIAMRIRSAAIFPIASGALGKMIANSSPP
jgi:hypothetical protein